MEDNVISAEPFINLLKRSVKANYGESIIMHNRMIFGCYNPENDGDEGFHHIQQIPDNEMYNNDFYSLSIILSPNALITAYNSYKKDLADKRKEKKLKPKDERIDIRYEFKDQYIDLTFEYIISNVIEYTKSIALQYPIDIYSSSYELFIDTYQKLINRIDTDFKVIVIDGIKSNLVEHALKSIRIYYLNIELDGVKISVPLIRSMLYGNKKFDEFKLSLRKTTIKNIFVYMITFKTKEIIEHYIGYIQNF